MPDDFQRQILHRRITALDLTDNRFETITSFLDDGCN